MVGFALLTAVVYAAAATLTGQAIAWWLEGVRQRRAGRWTVRFVGAGFVLVGVTLQLTHHLTNLLDQLPTKWVAISAVKGSQGLWWPLWGPLLAGMAAAGLLAFHLGARGCRWTQGQVSDGGLQPESRPVRRRKTAGSDLLALMQIDRASVWRSASLRRGALVMAILPGAIAAITEPSWDSLVLLTGLVAAGSGLLFGVNAFGMDGPGALTLEGLPMRPELRYWAKAATILEFSGLTVAGALIVGSVRADGSPTADPTRGAGRSSAGHEPGGGLVLHERVGQVPPPLGPARPTGHPRPSRRHDRLLGPTGLAHHLDRHGAVVDVAGDRGLAAAPGGHPDGVARRALPDELVPPLARHRDPVPSHRHRLERLMAHSPHAIGPWNLIRNDHIVRAHEEPRELRSEDSLGNLGWGQRLEK